jgi:hypothetical protein
MRYYVKYRIGIPYQHTEQEGLEFFMTRGFVGDTECISGFKTEEEALEKIKEIEANKYETLIITNAKVR